MANTYDIHQWYKAVNAIKAIANLPKDTNQGRNGDYIKQIQKVKISCTVCTTDFKIKSKRREPGMRPWLQVNNYLN